MAFIPLGSFVPSDDHHGPAFDPYVPMTLTYLGFHLLFVVPPVALLCYAVPTLPPGRRRVALIGLVGMPILALVYTTPWDGFLIERGVWWYGEGTVIARIGAVPVEEYLFFVLQPVLTGLFLYTMGFSPAFRPSDTRALPRVAGAVGFLAASVAGFALLSTTRGYYLGAILVWACPLLALQWGVGGGYLVRARHEWPVAVAIPTLYLWFADRVAIGLGVWTISEEFTTGIDLLGLPIEEATFFLVTNILVVQGLVLFEWVMHRWNRLTLPDDGTNASDPDTGQIDGSGPVVDAGPIDDPDTIVDDGGPVTTDDGPTVAGDGSGDVATASDEHAQGFETGRDL